MQLTESNNADNLLGDSIHKNFASALNNWLTSNSENDEDIFDSPYEGNTISCEYYDNAQFTSKFKNINNLSILSFNIQSLSAKFTEFDEFVHSFGKFKFDVICLQELWRLQNPDLFNLNGYHKLSFKSRNPNTQGGGVGIFVNQQLKVTQLPDYSIFIDKIVETIFIEIELPSKKKIIIGSVYRPNSAYVNMSSSQQLEIFLDEMNSVLSRITATGRKVYILGDFNIDLLKIDQHKPTAKYVNSLFSLGCLELMTIPTRCIHNSSTLIDHIITNENLPSYVCGALTNRISDHFPIFCFLNFSKPKNCHRYVRSRHINPASILNFKETLKNLAWTDTLTSADPQISLDTFLKNFLDLYNLHFPETVTKFNKNYHSKEKWMTNGLLTSRRNKMSLCTTSIKNPCNANIAAFKLYRNIYNTTVRAAKKIHFNTELQKNQKNLRETWKILKEATRSNKKKANTVDFLTINGIGTSDPKIIAEQFNSHFSTMAEKVASIIVPTDKPPDFYCKTFSCTFNSALSPVTISELLSATKELQSKNSSDHHGLSSAFL